MALPTVTSAIRGTLGIGGHSVPTPTPYLVALWRLSNGSAVTDNALANDASGGSELRTRNSVNTSAGFWTTPYGVFDSATTTFFGNAAPTEMEIGTVGTSFIFSCRMKSSTTSNPSAAATIFSKKDQTTAQGINLLINTTGAIIQQCAENGGTNQNLITATDICDGNEHSIVFVVDKAADRVIYIDGVDDYSSGTKDMTSANLDGDMTTPTTGFMLGGSSTLLDSGTINNPLFTAGVTISLRDIHLYMKTGALPTGDDLQNIVNYLHSNSYTPVPASIW